MLGSGQKASADTIPRDSLTRRVWMLRARIRTFQSILALFGRRGKQPSSLIHSWTVDVKNLNGVLETTVQPTSNMRCVVEVKNENALGASQVERQTVRSNMAFSVVNNGIGCSQLLHKSVQQLVKIAERRTRPVVASNNLTGQSRTDAMKQKDAASLKDAVGYQR